MAGIVDGSALAEAATEGSGEEIFLCPRSTDDDAEKRPARKPAAPKTIIPAIARMVFMRGVEIFSIATGTQ